MNKIKFNNVEMEVESYGKNTYFDGTNITSNGNCSVNTSDISTLNALISTPITSIQISHDNTIIYDLADINAKIDSINEYLNGDRMSISINFSFIYNNEEEQTE